MQNISDTNTSSLHMTRLCMHVWKYLGYNILYGGSLPEIAQYSPHFLPLNDFTATNGSNIYIVFAITAAGVVPCGGRKKSPRTSSIVQIIFLVSSFEIS